MNYLSAPALLLTGVAVEKLGFRSKWPDFGG